MRKFENFNPYVLLVFFMCNLLPAMFLMEIKLNLLLLISGIIYIWVLKDSLSIPSKKQFLIHFKNYE